MLMMYRYEKQMITSDNTKQNINGVNSKQNVWLVKNSMNRDNKIRNK